MHQPGAVRNKAYQIKIFPGPRPGFAYIEKYPDSLQKLLPRYVTGFTLSKEPKDLGKMSQGNSPAESQFFYHLPYNKV